MSITDKAQQLASQVSEHYETAKDLAKVINDKLPDDKKLAVPQLDKTASVKDNTSKLVNFIQTIDNFVIELDKTLKENLSAEQYAKVSKVTSTIEEILPIAKVVTKGLVSVVGPFATAIAAKLKHSSVLQRLKMKLEGVNQTKVVSALHESQAQKGRIDESHPGVKENAHELDEAIKTLGPEVGDHHDFATVAKSLVEWHKKSGASK